MRAASKYFHSCSRYFLELLLVPSIVLDTENTVVHEADIVPAL